MEGYHQERCLTHSGLWCGQEVNFYCVKTPSFSDCLLHVLALVDLSGGKVTCFHCSKYSHPHTKVLEKPCSQRLAWCAWNPGSLFRLQYNLSEHFCLHLGGTRKELMEAGWGEVLEPSFSKHRRNLPWLPSKVGSPYLVIPFHSVLLFFFVALIITCRPIFMYCHFFNVIYLSRV